MKNLFLSGGLVKSFCVIAVVFALSHAPAVAQKNGAKYGKYVLNDKINQEILNKATRVQVEDKGKITPIHVKDIRISRDTSITLKYQDTLITPNESVVKHLRNVMGTEFRNADFKKIPEVLVESDSQAIQRSYYVVYTSTRPLVYDFESQTFSTTFNFVLVEDSPENANESIKEVDMELTSDSKHTMSPRKLRISHVSLPSTEVKFDCTGIHDSVNVKIQTKTNPKGYETMIPVIPALEISMGDVSLDAWGIEQTPVTVRFLGSKSPDTTTVSFIPSEGSITPRSLTMRYNQTSTVFLRSGGIQEATLNAKTSQVESNLLKVNYKFPFTFLIGSILGGFLIGAYKSNPNFKKPNKYILCVIIGLVGSVLFYTLGIAIWDVNVYAAIGGKLDSSIMTAGGAFGVSALVALTIPKEKK